MYCPNCGIETSAERKYCRSCGMDLQVIALTISGEIQPDQLIDGGAEPARSARSKTVRAGFATLWGGLILAILLAIISEAVEGLNHTLGVLFGNLAPLGALVMLIGVGIMIYSRFLPKESTAQQSRDRGLLAKPQQMTLPPESFRQPVSSVTESTTRLFEEEPPASPKDGRLSE